MAGATVPDVMRALEMHEGGPASAMRVTDSRFTPHPGSKHACNLALRPVLIKVEYAALNPVDVYVMRGRLRLMGVPAKLPGVVGLDIAGTVAEVPGDASASSAAWAPPHDLKVGDRVFGCTSEFHHQGGSGALAEYCAVPAHGVAKLPDSVSFEGAATVGVAGLTAALGVWKHLGLSKEYDADNANTTLFVHGASTSVGQFAIQLAKAAGYRVVGTAGHSNHAYLTDTLGLDAAVDYHDDDFIEKLAQDPRNKSLAHAFECVGNKTANATALCFKVLKRCSGKHGRVVSVAPFQLRYMFNSQFSAITELITKCSYIPTWTSRLGLRSAHSECTTAEYLRELGVRLADGRLIPNRVKLFEGLDAGAKEGLQEVEDGKLSGVKAVVHVTA